MNFVPDDDPAQAPSPADMNILQAMVHQGLKSDVISLLKTCPADELNILLNLKNAANLTALHYAVTAGWDDVVTLMLEKGALSLTGTRPIEKAGNMLLFALTEGQFAAAKAILDHGFSINACDQTFGHSTLHCLLADHSKNQNLTEAVFFLHMNGADLDRPTATTHETPIFAAARAGLVRIVDYLLSHGANPARANFRGDTPLHAACTTGYGLETVRKLLEAGADVNAQDHAGRTALHVAAHHNRREIASLLLTSGANPFIKNNKDLSPDAVCQGPLQTRTREVILTHQQEFLVKISASKGLQNRR